MAEVAGSDESMTTKLDANSETDRVQLVAPRSLMQRVSAWRRKQEPIPNVSAAIRALLEIALEAEAEREARRDVRGGP